MHKPRIPASRLYSHVILPFAAFVGVLLFVNAAHVDLRLADWIYERWGSAWYWRDAWLTRHMVHDGGRALVGMMAGVLLLALAGSWLLPGGQPYRKGLSYLALSTLCAALLVNVLKDFTHVACPWDLTRYGGDQAYAGLLDLASWSSRSGACFPAGHASAGYAWFGLYYLALEYRPRWRWRACGLVVTMGLVFGAAQLLRGAHFFSHDCWTAFLCWFIATGLHALFFPIPTTTTATVQAHSRPPRSAVIGNPARVLPKSRRLVLKAIVAFLLSAPARADQEQQVLHLQKRWAEVNYQLEGRTQLAAFKQLVDDAADVILANPTSAEALIWSGIIKFTYAEARGGLGALSLTRAAKADLEQALAINADAMQGAAYTTLGALYYSVPGWPFGFRDNGKAEVLLKEALALNPDGIDANYYYADYLASMSQDADARRYLLKAQQAAPRQGLALADSCRQQEISSKLRELADK